MSTISYIETNVTADDFDGRIAYSDDTLFETPNPSLESNAVENAQYFDRTYHATSTVGASLTYLFQGTSLYVYSAAGPSRGSVEVTLDGTNATTVSAYAAENSTQPYLLYSTSGLYSLVTHNLTMTNLGAVASGEGDSMLLDYILSTVQLAPTGATVANHTIEDDNTTALTYSGTWGSNTNELFSGGSTRFTNGSEASVSFSFYGSAFYVYGDQNNDHGAYNITIDGGEPEQLRTPLNCGGEFRGGYCEKTDPGVQYFKAYLGPELHNVTITNVILDRFNYSYFDLDRIVYTTPSAYLNSKPLMTGNSNDSSSVGSAAGAGGAGTTGNASAGATGTGAASAAAAPSLGLLALGALALHSLGLL